MKYSHEWIRIIVLILIGIVILSFSRIASKNTDQQGQMDFNEWELEWMEDFSGTSIDTAVWRYMGRQKHGSWKYHSNHPENYELRNGILTLKGIKNDGSISDTATYLTGGIYTKGKKAFPPGKFEIRAKIKSAYGGTAAIWLMPFKSENGWPADGEIDIMEHARYSSSVSQTVHTSYTKTHPSETPKRTAWVNVDSEDFNVYGVEIFKDSLVFLVNQAKTLVYPKVDRIGDSEQFPFFKDWFILLNVNLNVGNNDSINLRELPVEMSVDWVKYYRLKD